MKNAVMILGILGALTAGGLGMNWMSDIGSMTEQQKALAQLSGQGEQMSKLATASFILVAGFFAGLAGAFLARKDNFMGAGIVLLVAGVLPLLFAPQAFLFTVLLIAGGVVAFVIHTKAKQPAALD